jgi:hypothetical protein
VLPPLPAPGGSSGSTDRGSAVVIVGSWHETTVGRDARSALSAVEALVLVDPAGELILFAGGVRLEPGPTGLCGNSHDHEQKVILVPVTLRDHRRTGHHAVAPT